MSIVNIAELGKIILNNGDNGETWETTSDRPQLINIIKLNFISAFMPFMRHFDVLLPVGIFMHYTTLLRHKTATNRVIVNNAN